MLANSIWKKLQRAAMLESPTLKLLRQRMSKH
jgi:hypothetical protein